jgi:hypothetical protein
MVNLLGYVASAAVLATFLMRRMVTLRLVAILSNVLFFLFGYIQHIYPVFFLHVALLPINTWRLIAVEAGETVQTAMQRRILPLNWRTRPYVFWFAVGLMAGLAGSLVAVIIANPQLV